MPRTRFKELGTGSFFGEPVYERAVPHRHCLREFERVVDWTAFTGRLVALGPGKGQIRRPPYNPAVILKMLVVAYLYGLSERSTEAHVNDSVSAKWFLGLAVDGPAPDHSPLTAFKGRIIERGGERLLQELLEEIIRRAPAAARTGLRCDRGWGERARERTWASGRPKGAQGRACCPFLTARLA